MGDQGLRMDWSRRLHKKQLVVWDYAWTLLFLSLHVTKLGLAVFAKVGIEALRMHVAGN